MASTVIMRTFLNDWLIWTESDPAIAPVFGYSILDEGCGGWCVDAAKDGLMIMELVWIDDETVGTSDFTGDENIFVDAAKDGLMMMELVWSDDETVGASDFTGDENIFVEDE